MEIEKRARKQESYSNFFDAAKLYLAAAKEYEAQKEPALQKIMVDCLYRAGACYTELEEYKKAILCYKKVVQSAMNIQVPEDKIDIYRKVANCCGDIASCLLAENKENPKYEQAQKFFIRGNEFFKRVAELEDEIMRKYVQERVVLYNGYISMIHIILDNPDEAKKLNKSSTSLIESYKIRGIGANTTKFIDLLLSEKVDDAKTVLTESIEPDSQSLAFSGSHLRAALMGLFHESLIKYNPNARLELKKVAIVEGGGVRLNFKAVKSMILHMLFFANPKIPKTQWRETAGWMIGKIDGEDVQVNDAFPIMTGTSTEFMFQDEHYVRASIIDSELFERNTGEFVVGWYHSHPGLSLFLSPTDIGNHLGFQGPGLNPKAIALVFDHVLFDKYKKNFGFKIFRLNDPTEGEASAFHEVKFDVFGMPDEFWDEVEFLVEDFIGNIQDTKESISLKELSEKLGYAEILIRDLVSELKKDGLIRDIYVDLQEDNLITQQDMEKLIVQMVKENKELPWALPINRFALNEGTLKFMFEKLMQRGLIRGIVRNTKEDFLRTD
ncbi:MAG: Mov34/MPN/PAD-1 family protein [Candidatus Helarchaeota archaeon]